MARLRWTKDFGQYKKGDEFDVSGDGLDQLANSDALEIVSDTSKVQDATIYLDDQEPAKETADSKAKTEKR